MVMVSVIISPDVATSSVQETRILCCYSCSQSVRASQLFCVSVLLLLSYLAGV